MSPITRASFVGFVSFLAAACEDAGSVGPEPRPEIVSPAEGSRYRAGQSLVFEGRAQDREDGELAPAALAWWVDFHHDDHTHPAALEASGASGTLVVPTIGEVSANVYFRFHLRATDADGNVAEVTRDVLPVTSHLTFVTEPAGLTILLDGQPHSTPYAVDSVVGVERSLGASDQDANGRHYAIATIDGAAGAPRTIATPESDTIVTFVFDDVGAANQPPEVALDSPDGATVGSPITLSATATDADGQVESVTFYDGDVAIGAADTAAPFEVSWTPTTAGQHTLRARARDDRGAVTTSASVVVVVAGTGSDQTPPTCTLTAPTNLAANLTGTIAATATADDDTGVVGVRFQLDGRDLGAEDTSAPFAASLPSTSAYASGQHVFRARARDAAGNVSPWSSAVVSFGGDVEHESGFSVSILPAMIAGATAFAIAPDGRLFVCEQDGDLKVVQNGQTLATPFVSITVDAGGERGLLGVALDPAFASNGRLYLYHTVPGSPPHNRISRYTADGNVADGNAPVVIWDLPDLNGATNHNGGAIHFGTDGHLYVAVGDNAVSANAQSDTTQLGKILRITSGGQIPTDNPFYGSNTGNARAIFAKGVRNPFSFAIHPGTGSLFVNDVGEGAYEEVNQVVAGANLGWPATEGHFDPDAYPAFTNPLFAYGHGNIPVSTSGTFLSGVAIVGATFYTPTTVTFPSDYRGDFFFGDYIASFLARYDVESGGVSTFVQGVQTVIDLATAPDGSIYLLGRDQLARVSAP